MRFLPHIAASLICLVAALPASDAFSPHGGSFISRPAGAAAGIGSSLDMASPTKAESFHRSLLRERLRYEGKVTDSKTQPTEGITAATPSAPTEALQRALLADRLGREAVARAEGGAAEATRLEEERATAEAQRLAEEQAAAAAKAVEDAKQAEIDRISAERAAQDAKQEEIDRKAAERLAEEAERRAASDEEARKLEDEKERALEELRVAEEEEARIAAAETAAEAERVVAEKEAAAAEMAAQAAKRAADQRAEAAAAAKEELEALASRTAELKARAKRVADRVPYLSGSRPLLPSGDDVSSALAKVQAFNPKELTDQLKLRKESSSELIRTTAGGLARAAVDGFGMGVEIADAIREDEELRSIVSEALDNASAAANALFEPSPLGDDDTSASLQRKAKIAYVALDSVACAVYASVCGVLGYGSEGPVSESASRAAEGLVSAISAAATLGLRSTDAVVQVVEERKAAEERIAAEEERRAMEKAKVAEVAVAREETVASSQEEAAPAVKEEETEDQDAPAEEEVRVVTKDPQEAFQRSLLEARLQSMKVEKVIKPNLAEGINAAATRDPEEAFQRSLLEARLQFEKVTS